MTTPAPDGEVLCFGDFSLDLGRACLGDLNGSLIHLRPKSFDLLVALAQRPRQLLRKDELLDAVWPNVHVTEDSLVQCIREIRRAIRDEAGDVLRTVARRGYILDTEVSSTTRSAATSLVSSAPAVTGEHEARPFVAVLPFHSAPDQDTDAWFAQGITEGIIHVLSGIHELLVISHGSSLAYAGAPVDPHRIVRELGVRYVLNGSVRRAGGRFRVATELSDATGGDVVRSDRYEGAAQELFDVQDQIAGRIAASLVPAVRRRELARAARKHPENLTSYDLVLQALDLLYQLDQKKFMRARGLLEQSIALDPDYATAYSHAATWHMFRIGQGWSLNPAEDIAAAARCASAALERDRENAVALAIYGHMLSFSQRDLHTASHFLDRAVFSGPSSHMAWTLHSATRGYLADGPAAIESAQRALRLSPFDPFGFFTEHMLSQAFYVNGDYEEAVTWGRLAAGHNSLLTSNLRTLAAALVASGRVTEARHVGQQVLAVEPNFRLSHFAARTPLSPAILETHIPKLRLAGLPE